VWLSLNRIQTKSFSPALFSPNPAKSEIFAILESFTLFDDGT
jgi:hypothetical protein